jgi:hypothetical protein
VKIKLRSGRVDFRLPISAIIDGARDRGGCVVLPLVKISSKDFSLTCSILLLRLT